MPKAWLAVRAEVPEAERGRFDDWYQTDHLPLALETFGARRAWRCWSQTEPGVHVAFYEFDSIDAARAATRPDRIAPLVADFDLVWGDRVPRRRVLMEVAQELSR